MKWLGCLIGLGLVAGALSESAGCGEAFSAATGTGGASGSSGHTGGASSSSSSGVAQCAAASCSLGTYCNPETSACESCVTSTRFHFGPPVVQAVTLPTAGASALYPRFMAPSTSEVFLVQVDGAHLHQIAEASYAAGTSLPWGPAALLVQLAGTHQDTGPLYLDESSILAKWVSDSVTNPSMPVLLFDSDRIAGDTQVFAVTLGGTAIDPVVVSLPGNAAHNSSIAVSMSASPVRFWWISDASTVLGDAGAPQLPRLVTATTMDTAPADVVLMLDEGCPAPLATSPWVTPLGDRLLFASTRPPTAPACVVSAPTVTHLYQVPVGLGGQETDSAELVFPDDLTDTDTSPALAPDQCTLFFSRVDDSGAGTVQIYAALRD